MVSIPLHVPFAWHFRTREPLIVNPVSQENLMLSGNTVKSPYDDPFKGTLRRSQSTAAKRELKGNRNKTNRTISKIVFPVWNGTPSGLHTFAWRNVLAPCSICLASSFFWSFHYKPFITTKIDFVRKGGLTSGHGAILWSQKRPAIFS